MLSDPVARASYRRSKVMSTFKHTVNSIGSDLEIFPMVKNGHFS